MTITRLTLVTGLAAALGIGAGCRDVRAPTADQQAKHVVESQDPNMAAPMPKDQASPPVAPYQAASGSDRQPVSGAELSYVTDDGKRGPIADPDTVTQIEQKLSSDGLYKGPIDGQPSADVVDSVRRFKAENRLGDDAAIDHATANRLGLDWTKVSSTAAVKQDLRQAADTVKTDVEKAVDRADQALGSGPAAATSTTGSSTAPAPTPPPPATTDDTRSADQRAGDAVKDGVDSVNRAGDRAGAKIESGAKNLDDSADRAGQKIEHNAKDLGHRIDNAATDAKKDLQNDK